MEKSKVRLTICGVDLVIMSEKPQAYIEELGTELNGTMSGMLKNSGRISATQAALLCALDAMDAAREANITSEKLRASMQDYLTDSSRLRIEAEHSRNEAEKMHRELVELRRKLPPAQGRK